MRPYKEHCQLEYPDGERGILDSLGMHEVGHVIRTNNGQASAVIKDTITCTHAKVADFGVSHGGSAY